jgi:hypothetical protein
MKRTIACSEGYHRRANKIRCREFLFPALHSIRWNLPVVSAFCSARFAVTRSHSLVAQPSNKPVFRFV